MYIVPQSSRSPFSTCGTYLYTLFQSYSKGLPWWRCVIVGLKANKTKFEFGIILCIKIDKIGNTESKTISIQYFRKNGSWLTHKWLSTRRFSCFSTRMRMASWPFQSWTWSWKASDKGQVVRTTNTQWLLRREG